VGRRSKVCSSLCPKSEWPGGHEILCCLAREGSVVARAQIQKLAAGHSDHRVSGSVGSTLTNYYVFKEIN
jgi:hypothetical protein